MQPSFKVLDTSKPLEFLEYVGRVAHNSESVGDPVKFLNKLIGLKHYSVFEHLWVCESLDIPESSAHEPLSPYESIYFINPFHWRSNYTDYLNARELIESGKSISSLPEFYTTGYSIKHPWFEFASVEVQCSIACARQWMRHRWPWAYMEKSLRHTKPKGVIYPNIDYISSYDSIHAQIDQELDMSISDYNHFIDKGVRKEDARCILPLATATRFIATAPLFAWNHLFHERAIKRPGNNPQTEIHELTGNIMEELKIIYGAGIIKPEVISFK